MRKIYVKRERLLLPLFIFIMDGPDNSHPVSQPAWEELIYISPLQHLPSLGECHKRVSSGSLVLEDQLPRSEP